MQRKKIKVNNKLRDKLGTLYGETDTDTGKIQINKKAHKGDKKELASTVKHEMLHAKHPKMLEKNVYKKSRKTKLRSQEIKSLLRKVNSAYSA